MEAAATPPPPYLVPGYVGLLPFSRICRIWSDCQGVREGGGKDSRMDARMMGISASVVQSCIPLAGLGFQRALSLMDSRSISSGFFLNHTRLWLMNPSDLVITIPKKSPAAHCSPGWGSHWPGLDLQGHACWSCWPSSDSALAMPGSQREKRCSAYLSSLPASG